MTSRPRVLSKSPTPSQVPPSLNEEAYRLIEEMIVTLELAPGSVVSEAMLSERIGIGHTPIREALQRLAARIPLTDLRYLVVAVLIQRESGGNLADLMTSISFIIRERLKLLGQIRTLSAEGRLSAWILFMLPVAICLVLGFTSPNYFNALIEDSDGKTLIMVAAGMMVLGALWMRKIIHIHI